MGFFALAGALAEAFFALAGALALLALLALGALVPLATAGVVFAALASVLIQQGAVINERAMAAKRSFFMLVSVSSGYATFTTIWLYVYGMSSDATQ